MKRIVNGYPSSEMAHHEFKKAVEIMKKVFEPKDLEIHFSSWTIFAADTEFLFVSLPVSINLSKIQALVANEVNFGAIYSHLETVRAALRHEETLMKKRGERQ